MAYYDEAIALGIGPQTAEGSINTDVSGATNLIPGVAGPTGATGILLRETADLSKQMDRIESDPTALSGSFSKVSGTFVRVNPTVSFTIDAMGNHNTEGGLATDHDFAEYFLQILNGARLGIDPANGAGETAYWFANILPAEIFKTLKIWRGAPTHTESWILSDCQFGLTWNLTAGEKATITVEVYTTQVSHNQSDTFPSNSGTAAYGNQILAAPILESASASLDGDNRGFQSGTVSIAYDSTDFSDTNVSGGTSASTSGRTVTASLDWIADDAADDYAMLERDNFGTASRHNIWFNIGQPELAGGIINAQSLRVPHLRASSTTKTDPGGRVVRTISGYSVIGSHGGFGGAADEEFQLIAV